MRYALLVLLLAPLACGGPEPQADPIADPSAVPACVDLDAIDAQVTALEARMTTAEGKVAALAAGRCP